MKNIQEPKCRMCGEDTNIRYIEGSHWDSYLDKRPTKGLYATCIRCGYSERIQSLEEIREEIKKFSKN